jgi:hypothetical protein
MSAFTETVSKLFGNDAIKQFIIGMLVKLVGGQIPPQLIVKLGEEHGKWLTKNGREALGTSWESLESMLQDVADNYLLGVHNGANSDDEA